ncbi:MAG: hypothetical protein V7607_120 [Solirubrobacteraceae bacterium]
MKIRDVTVATVRAALPEPIRFGDWVMNHREFALVRVRAADGVPGFGFTLTREGPVAAAIRQAVTPIYLAEDIATAEQATSAFDRCRRSNLACLSSGIGLRALSIVDLAVHDLLARRAQTSIARFLGGQPAGMPATAIVGYPPSMGPDAVRDQIASLRDAGWRRFKIPACLPLERARDRLLAAREAAGPDAWLGMDGAWLFASPDRASAFLDEVMRARLDWFEDALAPGDSDGLAKLRAGARGVPIAMGDEQGGSYYPDDLLRAHAVDAVRVDLTCMGGVSGAASVVSACRRAGVPFTPHMFAHVHSQVFAGWGLTVPIEWGVPGTGVDQYADSLIQPEVEAGWMAPLPEEPGFGPLVNLSWLREQHADDPDGLLGSLDADAPLAQVPR